MMDKEIKRKWLELLRSGEIKQTRETLKSIIDGVGMCCLGVLCELHHRETGEHDWVVTEKDEYRYYSMKGFLPTEVREWAGLDLYEPRHLMNMNDGDSEKYEGKPQTFDQIADYIEKNM